MILTKYITKPCVITDMEAVTKADAIKELTHLLFEKRKMPEMGPALDQIIARETTESTGIGRGIAVPHARVTGMKGMACAIGRIPRGLDFLAIDRKPVHLIFLICYPPVEQTAYLNFVATVAKLLGNPDRLLDIMQAETADDIFDLLEKASTAFAEEGPEEFKKLKANPSLDGMRDAHADLILLARLQLCQEMMDTARTGKKEIKGRIEAIRSMVAPRVLRHYERLVNARCKSPLVPVEGDTCQGCFMKLPTKFVQQVRQDMDHIHTCPNCSRYIYVV